MLHLSGYFYSELGPRDHKNKTITIFKQGSRLGRVVWFGNCVPTSIICSLPNFRTSDRLQKSILKTVFLISKSQNQLKLNNKQVLVGHIFKVRLFTYFLRGQLVAIMFFVLQSSH